MDEKIPKSHHHTTQLTLSNDIKSGKYPHVALNCKVPMLPDLRASHVSSVGDSGDHVTCDTMFTTICDNILRDMSYACNTIQYAQHNANYTDL